MILMLHIRACFRFCAVTVLSLELIVIPDVLMSFDLSSLYSKYTTYDSVV